MTKIKKMFATFLAGISIIYLIGCGSGSNTIVTPSTDESLSSQDESVSSTNDETENSALKKDEKPANAEIIAPSKEEVLAMRALVLENMSEEEINRLTENIKVANLRMENAFLYDNLFDKLEDKNHLYWNYFDKKGEIQIGWEYDGTFSEINELCKKENLTIEDFYIKYGTPVLVYNRFDANNFVELMSDIKASVHNEYLQNDMQYIIDETRLAAETHDMEHANNIYKSLHDMDYFLLRYGIEDVGKYTQDASIVSKYYGMLSIYSN